MLNQQTAKQFSNCSAILFFLFLPLITGPMSGMGMNMGMDGQWHYM